MVNNGFIDLTSEKTYPSERPRRIKQDWKTVEGLGFYTKWGALCKVAIIQGTKDGTRLFSINKGKQRIALEIEDADKLLEAMRKILHR